MCITSQINECCVCVSVFYWPDWYGLYSFFCISMFSVFHRAILLYVVWRYTKVDLFVACMVPGRGTENRTWLWWGWRGREMHSLTFSHVKRGSQLFAILMYREWMRGKRGQETMQLKKLKQNNYKVKIKTTAISC